MGWPGTLRYGISTPEDVIGHRRSLCGLASQGSHYPSSPPPPPPNTPFRGSNPFWSGPSSTNYARPPAAPTAREFNRPRAEKRWAPKRSSSVRRKEGFPFACPVLFEKEIIRLRLRAIYRWHLPNLYSVTPSIRPIPLHGILRVNASDKTRHFWAACVFL